MNSETAQNGKAREYSRLIRKLGASVELPSYVCGAPALMAYLFINFLEDGTKALAFALYCCVSCVATYVIGFLSRRAFLRPYALYAAGGSQSGSREDARQRLLDAPVFEAISIFARWLGTCLIIYLLAAAFGSDFGKPFWIFASICCALIGMLAMPASFLGAELACSPILNGPAFAEGRGAARPRIRLSLRLRLSLSVTILVDFVAAVMLLHIHYLRSGNIDVNRSMICLYLLIAGSMGMLFIIMNLFARSLSATVKDMNRKFEDMNKDAGDLSARLPIIAQDDIGRLSENFNGLMDFLGSSISEVKSSAEAGRAIGGELASTSEESSAAATQMAAGMAGLKKRTQGLMEASRGQKASLGAAGTALDSFLAKVDDQASAVEESSAAINQMIANLSAIEASTKDKKRLVELLKKDGAEGDRIVAGITDIVTDISRSAETIMGLVDVIGDISPPTGLLAMNAAIEAAHAGNAGRGFAVVADEIRKLAESTDRNSKDIAKSLGLVVDKIKRSAELSERTKTVFKKILEGIVVVDGSMEETLSGLIETSTGSGQIVDSVAELSSLTVGIREAGREIGERIRSIGEDATKVAELAEENERNADEINSGLGEIAQAAVQLSELGVRNAESISRLDGEVSRFRLKAD
jgi:methyl-accepting chemotaxis protein